MHHVPQACTPTTSPVTSPMGSPGPPPLLPCPAERGGRGAEPAGYVDSAPLPVIAAVPDVKPFDMFSEQASLLVLGCIYPVMECAESWLRMSFASQHVSGSMAACECGRVSADGDMCAQGVPASPPTTDRRRQGLALASRGLPLKMALPCLERAGVSAQQLHTRVCNCRRSRRSPTGATSRPRLPAAALPGS